MQEMGKEANLGSRSSLEGQAVVLGGQVKGITTAPLEGIGGGAQARILLAALGCDDDDDDSLV